MCPTPSKLIIGPRCPDNCTLSLSRIDNESSTREFHSLFHTAEPKSPCRTFNIESFFNIEAAAQRIQDEFKRAGGVPTSAVPKGESFGDVLEGMLRDTAEAADGAYLREEDAGALARLLMPLSEGKLVVSETRLAQSYWWFAPIVLFLAVEWIIRKRAGML